MEGYDILEELSSTTAKVRRTRTDKLFVTKKVSYSNMPKADRKRIVDTTNTLIQLSLRCPGIVRYHNTIVDSEHGSLNLMTDYCPGGSVESLIKQTRDHRSTIDLEKIWTLTAEIALTLYECHSNAPGQLAHGKLSSDHIFLDADGSVKIGCFSLNSCLEVDKEKDLVDLGIVVFELATLSQFTSKHQVSASKLKGVDEGLRNLMINLLNPPHVDQRMSLLNVLEYPEIALKILQKKLKIETEIYEQEKRRFLAIEEDLKNREKRLNAQGIEIPAEN
jgi:serine/threonine protein kinase